MKTDERLVCVRIYSSDGSVVIRMPKKATLSPHMTGKWHYIPKSAYKRSKRRGR